MGSTHMTGPMILEADHELLVAVHRDRGEVFIECWCGWAACSSRWNACQLYMKHRARAVTAKAAAELRDRLGPQALS